MGIDNPVHLIFIAVVALIFLGPKRLPELARAAGKGMREFRESLNGEGEAGHASAGVPPQQYVAEPPTPYALPAPAAPIQATQQYAAAPVQEHAAEPRQPYPAEPAQQYPAAPAQPPQAPAGAPAEDR